MKPENRIPTGRLCRPKALLLDFGGVVVLTSPRPDWPERLARLVRQRLEARVAASTSLSPETIAADIRAGARADSHWKDAMSRPFAPRELGQAEFWGDFVAADWPAPARAVVMEEAAELCRQMGHLRSDRQLRTGLSELLDACAEANVPVGVVSNALCGQVHLDYLAAQGLTDRFAVIIHSDEVGVRKPNPEMIHLAARALGLAAADCWYVGDNYDRDILCGRRAGVGGAILMEAPSSYDPPYELDLRPDAIVADPVGLLALFARATAGVTA